MNKQIEELAEQAGFTANDTDKVVLKVFGSELEKFAELIIKECANICVNLQDVPATEPRHCAQDILIHFGIE